MPRYEKLLASLPTTSLTPTQPSHKTLLPLNEALCMDCAKDMYHQIHATTELAKLQTLLKKLGDFGSRTYENAKAGFWVSKAEIRELLRRKTPPANNSEIPFNIEAQCEHGRLVCDEDKVICVEEKVWTIITDFFKSFGGTPPIALPDASDIGKPCAQCVQNKSEEMTRRQNQKDIAGKEKQELKALVLGKGCYTLQDLAKGATTETLYAVVRCALLSSVCDCMFFF